MKRSVTNKGTDLLPLGPVVIMLLGEIVTEEIFSKAVNMSYSRVPRSGEVNDVSLGNWGLLKDLYLLERLSCDNS